MLNYCIYKIGQLLALTLPIRIAYKVAVFVSDINYFFAKKDRRAVKENLKVIFPEKSDREIRRIRIRMFRNFAKYLVDFFRFSRIDAEYIKNNVRIENIHYLDEVLSKGKGAIALTAHLGNWELGGVVIALLGYPFWAVAMPHKHRKVDSFFNSQRESKGVKVIPLGRAVRQCLNLLQGNKIVALLGDRDFSEKGITANFFGRPAFLPEGPAVFSLKTGASIVPGFLIRNQDDSFTLRMEKPLDFALGNDKELNIRKTVEQYKVIIQDYIRKYPDQWYMFRTFWIT